MWVLLVLPLFVIQNQAFTLDSKEKCFEAAKMIKMKRPELTPIYCIPIADWQAGERGMSPENEVN